MTGHKAAWRLVGYVEAARHPIFSISGVYIRRHYISFFPGPRWVALEIVSRGHGRRVLERVSSSSFFL